MSHLPVVIINRYSKSRGKSKACNYFQDSFAALIWASLRHLRNPEVYQQHFISQWNGQAQVGDCYFCDHGIFLFFPSLPLYWDTIHLIQSPLGFFFPLTATHIPDICSMWPNLTLLCPNLSKQSHVSLKIMRFSGCYYIGSSKRMGKHEKRWDVPMKAHVALDCLFSTTPVSSSCEWLGQQSQMIRLESRRLTEIWTSRKGQICWGLRWKITRVGSN